MSYKDYAKKELKLVNASPVIRTLVLKSLDIINDQDHSGGSIGVLIGGLKQLNSKTLRTVMDLDDLRYDIQRFFNSIHATDEEIDKACYYLHRVVDFKPLSPLTGEDDEWNEVAGGIFQNNRYGSIFKRDGKAHWNDGVVVCYPSVTFCSWVGLECNKASCPQVEFPFTVPDEPTRIYYIDECGTPLPEGVDPQAYLKMKFMERASGLKEDKTFNSVTNSVIFTLYESVEHYPEIDKEMWKANLLRTVMETYVSKFKGKTWENRYEISELLDNGTPLDRAVARVWALIGLDRTFNPEDFTITGKYGDVTYLSLANVCYPNFDKYTEMVETEKKFAFVVSPWKLDKVLVDKKHGFSFFAPDSDYSNYLYSRRKELGLK